MKVKGATPRINMEACEEQSEKLQGSLWLPDVSHAAEVIFIRCGARAVSYLTSARTGKDGTEIYSRLSANDCYVAMDMATRKMARVALRKFQQKQFADGPDFENALGLIFPDPTAYLARAIKSVIADAERASRREAPQISLDAPIASQEGEGSISLSDILSEKDTSHLPEESLIETEERGGFRKALGAALLKIPARYLEALQRDMERENQRLAGVKLIPESDKDRQTVCRARNALAIILRRECSEDNPYIMLLSQQRASRVLHKSSQSGGWTGERQDNLMRKLLQSGWAHRAASQPEGKVEEAVINEVTSGRQAAPPSPEMRQAMRVLDMYTVSYPEPKSQAASSLYKSARECRKAGQLEEALKYYLSCYDAEPDFLEALNNAGNILSQLGRLREALRIFQDIISRKNAGDHLYTAATNAADIYLTWFDAGRNRENNIEKAIEFASLAMHKPTPMRACNLILAYAKDRYFMEARKVVDTILAADTPECPAEKFLQTLFQIRDKDLVTWWSWLEEDIEKEQFS